MDKILVSAEALRQVLQALNGPSYFIRELQATRNLPGVVNPINTLVKNYSEAVSAKGEAPADESPNTRMREALEAIKEAVCAPAAGHWDTMERVTLGRGAIAAACDVALKYP
jgi:hypothetical protein